MKMARLSDDATSPHRVPNPTTILWDGRVFVRAGCESLLLRLNTPGRHELSEAKNGIDYSRSTTGDCSHRADEFQFSAEPGLYDCLRHERLRPAHGAVLGRRSRFPSRFRRA